MKFLYFLLLTLSCISISECQSDYKVDYKKQYKPQLIITGINDKNILKAINEQVEVATEKTTETERRFWVNRNIKALRRVIYTFGYFDAEIIPANDRTSKKFTVRLNNRYRITNVDGYLDKLPKSNFFELSGLKQGKYFLGSEISGATNKIRDYCRENGFAFAQVATPDIDLDRTNKTVKVFYNVDLGKLVKIKNTIINIKCKKSPKLLEPFIRNRITWKSGDIYNLKKINYFKDELVKYKLFASLEVVLSAPECVDNSNYVYSDIILTVEEAPLREVELGAKFSSTQAFNLLAGWKHYNIDGKGSTFEVLSNIAKDEQTIKLEHGYYDLFVKNQQLLTQTAFIREDETSYNVLRYSLNSMLWQKLGHIFEFGIGGMAKYSKTVDKVVEDQNQINKEVDYVQTFGIPVGAKWDFVGNNLDPHKGIRIEANFTPLFSKGKIYSKLLTTIHGYFSLGKSYNSGHSIVCALYAKYGKLYGNTSSITRDNMFFAGGNNSVRGYGEKKLGKLLDRIPYGGTTLIETGIECRFRFSDTIGLVAFVESGKVYSNKSDQNWMTGWGIGIRYYTIIGPIRVDIAFPTKRRKDKNNKYVDSLFNIYVGIGQAF